MGKSATRDAYGKALAEFGGDERIVVLDADLSKSTKLQSLKTHTPTDISTWALPKPI